MDEAKRKRWREMLRPRSKVREWEAALQDDLTLYCRLETMRGRVIGFSVVLLHGAQCVTRYDTEHGTAHRDVLDRKGKLIRKEWLQEHTFHDAFEYARLDVTLNCRRYYREFCDRG